MDFMYLLLVSLNSFYSVYGKYTSTLQSIGIRTSKLFNQYKMFFVTHQSFLKTSFIMYFYLPRFTSVQRTEVSLFHSALACSCLLGPSPLSDEYLLVFVFFLLFPISSLVSPIFKSCLSSSSFSSVFQGQFFHPSLGCPVHACFLGNRLTSWEN